ncbi:Retrovirus-related Pol polyprotein from transposon TNT 1-94 [Lachnellula cervina]|uniref:Retrovirus-related Pol polyprotein from transposon TNT 1-94 n=1 Tax=Lachnellula cervina TaxID=1316786 RepID=A0A7D8YNI6_9HELO|nr:Retrovirus-related Pol polyprotein from transposon TNT 1-94 [Lachnellula cervina]
MTLASYGPIDQETSLVYNGLNDYESKFHKTQLILDSGASEHYIYNKDWLLDYKSISNKSIRVANSQSLAVLGKGNIPVKANNNKLIIKDVFYVPDLRANLISTKELINKSWNIIFKKELVEIVKNTIRVTMFWRYNAYYLNMLVDFNELEPIVYYTKPENNKLDLYHKRLNHLNKDILLKTIDNTSGLSLGNNKASSNSISDCELCFIGKFHNIGSKTPISTAPVLSVYNIDIAGPMKPLGLKGEKYFMTITDRGSRGAWVFPIKYKGDAYSILVKFFNMIKTQFPKAQIKALKLDNAKEFKFTICKAKNIPLFLWPYLVQAIIYIKNRTYNSIINKTPFEALTDKKPFIGYIKILGSLVYTLVLKETRKYGKLFEKGNKGILIGFESANNFLVYLPIENKVISTKNLIIKEDLVYTDEYNKSDDNNYLELLELSYLDDNTNLGGAKTSDLPNSNNKRKVNSTLASYAYITSKIENNSPKENSSDKVIIYKNQNTINSIYKPKSYNEAKNSEYKDFWSKAEAKEIRTLESNNARWAYKLKDFSDHYEFKARFVAKGFEQLYKIDYIDTFAAIKELGLIKDYLGIDIDYKPKEGTLKLYIAKYINKILNKFGFNNLNPFKTPMDSNIKLEPNKEQASPAAIKYF